jgi:hypothetical protein
MLTPPGQCPQCWAHAHDKSHHSHLKWNEDCQQCIDCKAAGHPNLIPKKESSWW